MIESRAGSAGTSPSGQDAPTQRRRIWLWVTLGLLTLIGSFAGVQIMRTGTKPDALRAAYGFSIGDYSARTAAVAEPAPAIRGRTLDGETVSLSDYRGKIVVVNSWASWCGPCRKEQPELERVWRDFKGKGVQFLGIDVRDEIAGARAFRDEFGVTYPSLFDPSSEIAAKFKIQVLPSTLLIDPNGKIAFRLSGRVDEPLLTRLIEQIRDTVAGADRG